MIATKIDPGRRPRSARRAAIRGSTTTTLLGGIVLLLFGLGLGLTLSSQRAETQGAYEPPVIPGRVPTWRTPVSRVRSTPASPPATPSPIATSSPNSPPADTQPSVTPATAFALPRPEVPTAVAAVPPSSPSPAPFPGAPEIVFRLSGADALPIADAAAALARTKASSGSAFARARFVPSDRALPLLEGARAVIAVEATGLRVGRVSPPPLESDVIAALMPPLGLVGEALDGFLLPVGARYQTVALTALCALLAGDADACLSLVDGAGGDAGVRVLASYAHLVRKELSAVHSGVLGLGTDADVGPVARFLTGVALLMDGNAREALRDFAAAIVVRPGYWPARLFAGTANDRLVLPEAARDQFAAVLAAVPGRPEAVIGYAPHLAETDRPAAIALVETCLAERPTLVPAWWQLAWLRRKGDTSEDLLKGVEALQHVVALRPDDADAWGALALAHSRWASSGGGVEAFRTPLDGDRGALGRRVLSTAAIYAKALARGLPKSDAARVQFNLGLLLDAVSAWPEGVVATGLPRRAADAYAAAIEADPGYAEAAMKLLAARIGDRDVKAAMKVLAALPPGVDPKERAVLEAALAHVRGDPAGAVRQLTGPARVAVTGADPLTPLARELLLLDDRRLVLSLLGSESRDPARLAIRVRARAGLGDVEGTTADLAALRSIDAPRADDLRRNDKDVRRTLGAALAH